MIKTRICPLLRRCAILGLATGIGLSTRAYGTEDFPQTVPFEIGRTQLAPGDSITIQSVRVTAATFQTNETYCVEGTYTLSSHDEAVIALHVTSRQDLRTKIDPRQMMRIKKGSGTFRLIKTMGVEGNPHVSFYPTGSGGDFGGVYFGKGEWLWAGSGGSHGREDLVTAEGANRALLDYLGNPVTTPPNLDAAYTPTRLRDAVLGAAKAAGVSLRRAEVDDSEFPFLIWVAGDEGDFEKLKAQFATMPGYEYYGSVGGHGAHAFTIIPRSAWPAPARQRIYRRAMLRMQVFYDRMASNIS